MLGAAHLALDGTGEADVCRPHQPPGERLGQERDGAADRLHDGHQVRGRHRGEARSPASARPTARGGATAVSDGARHACGLLQRRQAWSKGRGGRRHASHSCRHVSCAGWPPTSSGRQAASRGATRNSSAPFSGTRARAARAGGPWKGGAGWSSGARLAGKPHPGDALQRGKKGCHSWHEVVMKGNCA